MEKNYTKLFNTISELLTNRDFFQNYLFEKKHFTRTRELSFQTVVLLILRLLKCSLKTELKSFYTALFKEDNIVNWVSNAALCKARQKIRFELFKDLCRILANTFYSINDGDKWKGFRLLGVDGSEINLPSSKELIRDFKVHHTNSIGTEIPQARISFLSDVLNKVTIDAAINSFKIGEQEIFREHLKYVGINDLITADANYGHFWVFRLVQNAGAEFCFRINHCSGLIKSFLDSGEKDVVLEWEPSYKSKQNAQKHGVDTGSLKVRLVRIDLENETEVLVTSLLDQDKFTYEKSEGLKYRRCINWTSAIGDVRSRFILFFLRNTKKVHEILESLYDSFSINTQSIKPGRKFKRDKRKKGSRKKAFICYKSAW